MTVESIPKAEMPSLYRSIFVCGQGKESENRALLAGKHLLPLAMVHSELFSLAYFGKFYSQLAVH